MTSEDLCGIEGVLSPLKWPQCLQYVPLYIHSLGTSSANATLKNNDLMLAEFFERQQT